MQWVFTPESIKMLHWKWLDWDQSICKFQMESIWFGFQIEMVSFSPKTQSNVTITFWQRAHFDILVEFTFMFTFV